ncbi:MAG: hypothetical protein WBG46_15685 [Nonlabens sp.]
MKIKILTLTFLAFAYLTSAQLSFLPAKLTIKKGQTIDVSFKTKSKILNKGEITIYNPQDHSKLIYDANQFLEFKADGIEIVTATIPDIKSSPIILRKITNTNPELYQYTSENKKTVYVLKENTNYQVLRINKKAGGSDYKEWLYNNYNKQNFEPSYFSKLNYTKSSLAEYLNPNSDNYMLKQEPKVDVFNLFISAGYNVNSLDISSSRSYAFDASSAKNFQIGLKGQVNLDRLTNNLSAIGGVNYQTNFRGSDKLTVFPNSNINRTEERYSYNLDFIGVYFGLQYNWHINHFTISPYASFEPVFLKNSKDNVVIEYENFNLPDIKTIKKRNNSTIFNLGLNLSYSNKYQLNFSYGSFSNLPLLMDFGTEGGIFNLDLSRIQLGFSYRVL